MIVTPDMIVECEVAAGNWAALRKLMEERNIRSEADDAYLDYSTWADEPRPLTFIRVKGSRGILLECPRRNLHPAPLWMFIRELPVKNDYQARQTFRRRFGELHTFIFASSTADTLLACEPTITGFAIRHLARVSPDIEGWLVGYQSRIA